MSKLLVISVRLHEGRYHGAGDWPPSPARLFQALIAGAGLSGPLQPEHVAALKWLEECTDFAPPSVAAPSMQKGQSFKNFVPNNDLDAVGGDPRNIGAIRVNKLIRPRLFDASQPLLYAWPLPENEETDNRAKVLFELADRVYQFGRGIDMACAWAEVMDQSEWDKRLAAYNGTIDRPSGDGEGGRALPCPTRGSLDSLERRYAAGLKRFEATSIGRTFSQSFRQLPKPRFRLVAYDSHPFRRLFELREYSPEHPVHAWPLRRTYLLMQTIRDAARTRLVKALASREAAIDCWLVGRKADGSYGGSPQERIRMIPMPSIGHRHADHQIRRVFVEVPPNCPIAAEDVFWAFNGLELPETRPLVCLSAATDEGMLHHYGLDGKARIWRTVTPAALPESARRRRIDPKRRAQEAKSASERASEQQRARAAVLEALRHANIRSHVTEICVQREPFEAKGERVEAFSGESRFPKERLWHVRVAFAEPAEGPIVIGDGRFAGLGLMAPVIGLAD